MVRDRRFTKRKTQFFFGALLAGILYSQLDLGEDNKPTVIRGAPVVLAAEYDNVDPFEKMLRTNPLDALKFAHQRYASHIKDYECVFTKQELLPSGMSPEQEIGIKFRREPYSVVMTWQKNAGLAKRVIYVKDKWIDESETDARGRQQMICQPGNIAALLIKSLKQPINGVGAKKSGRRAIDEFGFQRALELLIQYCERANLHNELRLVFRGESTFNNRPVWVISRHLPYDGDEVPYPDRTADIYLDKVYHVPVAVYCYSDEERKPENLLGKYEYRDIHFDVGLTEKDFDPATYGM